MATSDIDSLTSSYSRPSRFLHRLALGNRFILQATDEFDQITINRKRSKHSKEHVFICGLARSGSTLLLNFLYGTGTFCSLTYADMPFPLMPGTWSRLRKHLTENASRINRAHGDNMTISLQDPEALEEVFWKLYTRSSYISEECLVPHDISRECQKGFENYLARIIFSKEHRQGCRYLSKNNNNILRLRSILSLFPEAKAIVPFRHPLSHSNSLLNQHKRFCKLQEKDGFVEEYMTLLGHHEFGRAHKPFFFGSMPMRKSNFPIGGVDYWLNIWNNTYSFLLDTVGDGVM